MECEQPQSQGLYPVKTARVARLQIAGDTTMRFMILLKSDASVEAGAIPSEEYLAAMLTFNEELVKAGGCWRARGFTQVREARV
jgi:hypothetical protein